MLLHLDLRIIETIISVRESKLLCEFKFKEETYVAVNQLHEDVPLPLKTE